MRKWKALAALTLSALMAMSLAAPAVFAEGEEGEQAETEAAVVTPAPTITIKETHGNNDGDHDHVYLAYQIFKGDLKFEDSAPILSNIEWGANINGSALLTELNGLADDYFTVANPFKTCAKASDIAEKLKGFTSDSVDMRRFSEVVAKHLTGTPVKSDKTAHGEENTINVASKGYGYYLVKDDTTGSPLQNEYAAYTTYILSVVGPTEVDNKGDVPSMDKMIVENGAEVPRNTAAIGDDVNYNITITMPNTSGYQTYYMIVTDEMDKGLTYKSVSSVRIMKGATKRADFVENTDYRVKTKSNEDGTTTLTIDIKGLEEYVDRKDTYKIEIDYVAMLNKDADLTTTGNNNTAQLQYANNPYYKFDNTKWPSDETPPTGQTPEYKVTTYSTKFQIKKVGGSNTGSVLDGAEFDLENVEGEAAMNAVVLNGADPATTLPATNVPATNGYLKVEGVKNGKIRITEVKSPEGYNKLAEPILVTITASRDANNLPTGNFTISAILETSGTAVAVNGSSMEITVVNNKGTTLPSTGGIGTVLFYVVGSGLVIGAGVLYVTKRRAEKNSK